MSFDPEFINFLSLSASISQDEHGYQYLPQRSSSPIAFSLTESQAGLSLCPLLNWSWLEISGEEAQKFLQGQLTCDLNSLTAHKGHLGAHCDLKGRVLATFYIYLRNEAYHLHLPSSSALILQKSLKKYALFSKVKIDLLKSQPATLGIAGRDVYQALRHYIGAELPQPNQQWEYQGIYLYHIPGLTPRFVCSSNTADCIALWESLHHRSAIIENEAIWTGFDIQNHLAHIVKASSAQFTPQALSLIEHHAVSFTKGCYTGQEIVARLHYLGKSKQQLSYLKLPSEEIYQAGDTVLDPTTQITGKVVASYIDPIQKHTQHLLWIQNPGKKA